MWPGWLVGIEEELWGRAGQEQAEARAPAGIVLPSAAQQGPAAHLQAVQPCSGRPDPTEAHGEPRTGSPAPASPPTAHWPPCLCWACLLFLSPPEHLLSAGLPHGKVRLPLVGGNTRLAQTGKAPHSLACLFLPSESPCSDGSLSMSSTRSWRDRPRSLRAEGLGKVGLERKEPE